MFSSGEIHMRLNPKNQIQLGIKIFYVRGWTVSEQKHWFFLVGILSWRFFGTVLIHLMG